MHKGFTGSGNVPHQMRRAFEIPVGTGDTGVPHIGGQRQHMTPDVLSGLGALLQGAHGKGVPEIHEPGTSTSRGLRNPCRREHLVKRLGHHRARERTMATGDKQMWARPGDAPALGEILLECRSRRGMQREQTAFLELTVPDVQPITVTSMYWRARASATRIPVTASRPNSVL